MKTTILAIAAFAALASAGARADEFNGSEGVLKFEGTRTRAEVKAEATQQARDYRYQDDGVGQTRFAQSSTLDAKVVRAEAAQALRLGQIAHGEIGNM